MSRPVRLGITLGDINGIGPEVSLKAVYRRRWPRDVHFVFIGSEQILEQQAAALHLPAPDRWNPGENLRAKVSVWDPARQLRPKSHPGKVSVPASKAAAVWIATGAQACMDGTLDAITTAPINKKGFDKAGLAVPGHTEYLAQLTGTRDYAMMLMGGPLKVVPLTRHIPLSRVPRRITGKAIRDAVRLIDQGLRMLGSRRRRIAVCGLNPHAGDGGTIGTEDEAIIAPAVDDLAADGYRVTGPVPADVVFYQAVQGHHDAILAMYHDQGLGPLKMLAFEEGVNLTLGLPIVRTSPDHGTAFDIAGRNKANPSSMVEALRVAYQLAKKKNPWKK